MTEHLLHPSIRHIERPARIARLPLSPNNFPVPWFVATINGAPDFRVIDTPKMSIAVKQKRCWICGEPTGRMLAFVIGPMCVVNRISSEPPSHLECARYAATACPFLTRPTMHRREAGLPEERTEAAGIPIERNPGVAVVYVTRDYRPIRAPGGIGVLFELGDPVDVLWLREGRDATRDEALDALNTGLQTLLDLAAAEGGHAIEALHRQVNAAGALLPPQPARVAA